MLTKRPWPNSFSSVVNQKVNDTWDAFLDCDCYRNNLCDLFEVLETQQDLGSDTMKKLWEWRNYEKLYLFEFGDHTWYLWCVAGPIFIGDLVLGVHLEQFSLLLFCWLCSHFHLMLAPPCILFYWFCSLFPLMLAGLGQSYTCCVIS